ncbi:MAG TPA: hemolysin family protein [Burkholderiales bacterium]|nr:hemolysin family protein [Burkholderiales bacterium]
MALLTIVLLILLNGVFAMSEMAVIASRRARLRERVHAGDRRAAAALELHNAPNVFLSTIQVGITLIGVLLGAVGERVLATDAASLLARVPALAPYRDALALGLVVVAITYLSLVVGELVPKRLALYHPEAIARVIARPMRLLSRLTYPAVQLLSASVDICLRLLRARPPAEPTITEEEIRSMIEEGTRAGVLLKAEQDLLTNVIRFADRSISLLMTPHGEIVWLDLNDAPEVNMRKIAESPHGRFPVARESLDHVVGLVQSKDLLTRVLWGQPLDIEAAVRPVPYVPDSASPLNVLEMFRTTPEHMALVVDEYGEVRGLVTLTGILEAIVGALPAAGAPPEPKIVRRADGSWLIDGMLSVVELKETLGIARLPEEEEAGYETLAGFVLSQLGRIPHIGDHFVWNDLRFEIVDMDANRIDRVLVAPLPPSAGAPAESVHE